MELIEAFTDGVWEGTARFAVEDEGLAFGPWPVRWDPLSLVFTFALDRSSKDFDALCRVDWWHSFKLRLFDIRIGLRQWRLVAHATEVHRLNPLSEWPEDWGDRDEGLAHLTLGSVRADIEFQPSQLEEALPHAVWWDNWPRHFGHPAVLEELAIHVVARDRSKLQNANVTLLGIRSANVALAPLHDRFQMVLSLACGRSLPARVIQGGHSVKVFRQQLHLPEGSLPMFKDGQSARPLERMLRFAVQLAEEDFGRLRHAAALVVDAKGGHLALEVRYLLLMMCVEMLDGQPKLSKASTAQMLQIDLQAADLLNDMRNKLFHGHQGGGYRKAFEAVVEQRPGKVLPVMTDLWEHCINRPAQQLRFERLFFQLCERIDAFWCRTLESGAVNANRFHFLSKLGELSAEEN